VVRANDLILESEALLRRTLGEDVELSYRLSRHAGSVEVDPGQFTQVLVNLAVNARDAMPGGGRLVVDTSSITWDGSSWMRLTVADNGHGMDQETVDRVFEPFFTTKQTGEGTGLGLATVYGIVAQSGGKISVSSEVGAGSIFTVLLPSVAQAEGVAPQVSEPTVAHNPAARSKAQATILVVEDEAAVRSLTARVLRENGYEVLAAANGSEAAALAKDCKAGLNLLLTDVVLPGELQGDGVARVVLEQCPGIKTMFMSGYPRDVIAKAGRLSEGVNYLEKPFSPAALLRRVKELIDAD
jgi:CheY-like chemotaxis protein